MKERIPDSDFINNVRTALEPLKGKKLKITVRTNKKNDLKTYNGTLQSVSNDTFTLRDDYGDEGLLEFNIIDVHYFGAPYEKEPFGRWPARFR